ncbi:MAG: hypothetical protein AAF806_21330 [Bacteroidota bacterium]
MRKILPNNWERYLKRSLEQHQTQWDEEELWQGIEPQLPKPRKRRPLLFFYFLGVAVLLGTVAVLIPTPDAEQSEPFVSKPSTTDVASLVDSSRRASNTSIPTSILATNNDKSKAKSSTSTSSLPIQKTQPIEPLAQQSSTAATPKPITALSQSPLEELVVPMMKENSLEPIATQQQFQALHRLPIQALPVAVPKIEGVQLKNQYPQIGISPYMTIALTHRTFNALSDAATGKIDTRRQLEQALESMEMGILLDLQFNKNWAFQFGLARQQISERFEWSDINQRKFSIQSDSAYFYLDGQNQKQYLEGKIEAVETRTRLVRNYNRFTLYNIPLLVRYSKRDQRFGWHLSGGAIVNFRTTFEGRLLENASILESTDIEAQGIYQSTVGLAWQLGAGIDYQLTPRSQLSLLLHHRRFLNTFTSPTTDFEQRYGFTGVGVAWKRWLK